MRHIGTVVLVLMVGLGSVAMHAGQARSAGPNRLKWLPCGLISRPPHQCSQRASKPDQTGRSWPWMFPCVN